MSAPDWREIGPGGVSCWWGARITNLTAGDPGEVLAVICAAGSPTRTVKEQKTAIGLDFEVKSPRLVGIAELHRGLEDSVNSRRVEEAGEARPWTLS